MATNNILIGFVNTLIAEGKEEVLLNSFGQRYATLQKMELTDLEEFKQLDLLFKSLEISPDFDDDNGIRFFKESSKKNTIEGTSIPREYEKSWSIYKKYFPEGNEGEFDKSFVTFDATMEDVDKMNNTNYLLLEGVVFDISKINSRKYNQVINPDFKVGDKVIYDSCGKDIEAIIIEIKEKGTYPIIISYNDNINPVNKNQIKLIKK